MEIQDSYVKLCTTSSLPFMPIAAFDNIRKSLVHLYEFVNLEPSNFQEDISQYLSRRDSFSTNVASIYKLKDEQIKFKEGKASLDVTVVTDYVPWRLHQHFKYLTYEQGMFLLDGALKGFR